MTTITEKYVLENTFIVDSAVNVEFVRIHHGHTNPEWTKVAKLALPTHIVRKQGKTLLAVAANANST